MRFFRINGYWKDNKEEFEDFIVTDTDGIIPELDDEIFMYGMEESFLKGVLDDRSGIFDFVITSYREDNKIKPKKEYLND